MISLKQNNKETLNHYNTFRQKNITQNFKNINISYENQKRIKLTFNCFQQVNINNLILNKEFNILIDKEDNGLTIAKKLNSLMNLRFNEKLIINLARKITKEINFYIKRMKIDNYSNNMSKIKIHIDLEKLQLKQYFKSLYNNNNKARTIKLEIEINFKKIIFIFSRFEDNDLNELVDNCIKEVISNIENVNIYNLEALKNNLKEVIIKSIDNLR